MNKRYCTNIRMAVLTFAISIHIYTANSQVQVLHDVTVIDGTGKPAKTHQNVQLLFDRILSINPITTKMQEGATVIHLEGKTIMPLLVDTHAHLGILKDTATSSANYTPENIRQQVALFQDYGVGAILSLGTDHENIFGMRQESQAGQIAGATIYTAGMGFGVKNAMPPASAGMDKAFRPESEEEARKNVRQLAASKPDVIKLWVDDSWGKFPKMKPEVYRAVIDEAHKHGIRVASHVFYLEDARSLISAGLDILAHSIRDKVIDANLLSEMKKRKVVYVPTLSLDEFAFAYEGNPEWINDPFFKASLGTGVYEMIKSEAYKNKVKANPVTPGEMAALKTALKNLKKVYDAGIMIALGTDAGAQPIRAIGFSEHMELQLMVKAGIPPLQAIRMATLNGATLLRTENETGTLAPGKKADFIVLNKNPAEAVSNTRTVSEVWKNGKKVSEGPVR